MSRVLLVDDEVDLCWTLRCALEDEGLHVVVAHTLREARATVERGARPGLALVDARLPDGEGLAFAGELRALARAPAVLLLSGYYFDFDSAVREAVASGIIAGFLAKPVPIARVRELAREARAPVDLDVPRLRATGGGAAR